MGLLAAITEILENQEGMMEQATAETVVAIAALSLDEKEKKAGEENKKNSGGKENGQGTCGEVIGTVPTN